MTNNMTIDRCIDLVNNLIDKIMIGKKPEEVIRILISNDFTKKELIDFGFSENDIDDVIKQMQQTARRHRLKLKNRKEVI